jgi:hypothetical protein
MISDPVIKQEGIYPTRGTKRRQAAALQGGPLEFAAQEMKNEK